VNRSVWKGKFGTPKSKASFRRIDMSPYLALELRKHILASQNNELDLVFSNTDGNLVDPDTMVRRHFLPALKRAGIRKIRFHDLRHTNVALRIEQGQNIKYIQNQLGHASIQTTLDRYGHLINDVNTEQAKKLDRILGFDDADAPQLCVVEKW
jgi:integrase